jgi:hypothetical protein
MKPTMTNKFFGPDEEKRDELSMKRWSDSTSIGGATYVEGVTAGRMAQRNPPTTGF